MFNLRKEQLKVFDEAAAREFESRVIAQLLKEQTDPHGTNDRAAFGELVRYGIDRAKAYQLTAEEDVLKYIRVMLALGKDFDRDPRYPWASRTLNDPSLGSATAKADRLSAAALEAAGGKASSG